MNHFVIVVPESWDGNKKGDFFEAFVAKLLRPMRFEVVQRLRFTGMEIDLLAKERDQSRKVLVECKAHTDPLPADVITKMMGNRELRGADSAWLFSTCDLTKDGKAIWEDIQENRELNQRFAWFPPSRLCELCVEQGHVRDPVSINPDLGAVELGDWTLVVKPGAWLWIVETLESSTPTGFSAFDAKSGASAPIEDLEELGPLGDRLRPLTQVAPTDEGRTTSPVSRAPVARVASGDTWEDPRPSRPTDFVGRDSLLGAIADFFEGVRGKSSSTRSFAIQAPSGWGKSSLTLKLAHLVQKARGLKNCSITAVDSRSATSGAFVAEAVGLAFRDARDRRLIPKGSYRVSSLQHPLRSSDLQDAYSHLEEHDAIIVLIFDQFEELFSKEHLFEVFRAVRELTLDLDASQLPFVLGFAWKTDISLPQQHPAYHLWHELADRRRVFEVSEFGTGEVKRVIGKAERALKKRLSPALRARLVEQCQGLPWLLKKLLVHVLQRVTTPESQYLLLERELDVEVLFREDLQALPEGAIRCLRYVAQQAPVPVPEVEENFDRDTANLLLGKRLIVRSGLNYVIYWDIFRDYLVEGRVPKIPWARTFQRDPVSGVLAIKTLSDLGPSTAPQIAAAVGLKEGPCFNLLGDLVALQLVDRLSGDRYSVSAVLPSTKADAVAVHARGQLERHVVARAIASEWERGVRFGHREWTRFFAAVQPGSREYSESTIRHYSANLRRWLVFAGLLEQVGAAVCRPAGPGSQMGILKGRRVGGGTFLGFSSPERVLDLLAFLLGTPEGRSRAEVERNGLRNASTDALALELVQAGMGENLVVAKGEAEPQELRARLLSALHADDTIRLIEQCLSDGIEATLELGDELEGHLATSWAESSKKRYVSGIMRFVKWHQSQAHELDRLSGGKGEQAGRC